MTRNVTSTELAVLERLVDVGRLLNQRSDRMLSEHTGLSATQYEILVRLRNAGGELRMRELADAAVKRPSVLTYQLKQLELRGLAERRVAADDERGVVAQITSEGLAMVAALFPLTNESVYRSIVEPLEPVEVETLHYLLGKLQLTLRGAVTGGLLPGATPLAVPMDPAPTGPGGPGHEAS